jgi:hypothetical protein
VFVMFSTPPQVEISPSSNRGRSFLKGFAFPLSLTHFLTISVSLSLSHRHQAGRAAQWTPPPTSIAFSNSRVIIPNNSTAETALDMEPVPLSTLDALTGSTYNQDGSASLSSFNPLPMFCSHCPGWICYAEKTHPQSLPYISRAKSAQQILGSIFKHILTQPSSLIEHAGDVHSLSHLISFCVLISDSVQHENASSWAPQDIFHVSIQPCFDKKLEASRLVSLPHPSPALLLLISIGFL